MSVLHNKKHVFYFLYFVFLLVLIYAVQDFQTSANTTGVNLPRRGVHAALFVILMVLGAYYAHTTAGGRIVKHAVTIPTGKSVKSHVKASLWFISGWVVVVNLLQSANVWSSQIHLGLSILWILVYHLFSYYLRRFPNAWPQIQVGIMVMFGFYVFSALYGAYTIENIYDRIAVVNLAYGVIVFLPWILLINAKKMRLFAMGIVFLVVLISMKRGAIVVLPIMLSASLLVDAVVNKKGLQSFIKIIAVTLLFFAGLSIVDQFSGGYLSMRFSSKQLVEGSGRAEYFSKTIDEILQRDLFYLMLGRGSGSSIQFLGTGVHNEWLEFLFSFGVIGVVFYLRLFYALARNLRELIRKSSRYAPAYAMAFVYMLVVGMYGGIYFVHSTLYIMALYGAIEGLMINDMFKTHT
jgi:hypothetical protein